MQLQFLGLVALAALVSAQQTNTTATSGGAAGSIYDLLSKNQKSYGATKFEALLKSDPGYKPVIDVLSNPGNLTVFIPNDKAIDSFLKDYKSQAKVTNASALPKADATYNNVTIADILKYHVVQGNHPLAELNSTVNILETALDNDTVYKLDGNAPIVISNEVSCKTFLNPTWHQKNNNSIKWEVGNGDDDADVVKKDIKASNGHLNIISEVLAPPPPPTQALKNERDVSTIYKYISSNKNLTDLITNGSNFTIFIPNNNAIKNAKLTNLTAPAIEELVKNHIIKGVYYSTNLTDSSDPSAANTTTTPSAQNVTIVTANGYELPVSVDNCKIKLNNSATITQPNILLDNGVVHVIDHVLNVTEPQGDTSQYDPFASATASGAAAAATTNAAATGASASSAAATGAAASPSAAA